MYTCKNVSPLLLPKTPPDPYQPRDCARGIYTANLPSSSMVSPMHFPSNNLPSQKLKALFLCLVTIPKMCRFVEMLYKPLPLRYSSLSVLMCVSMPITLGLFFSCPSVFCQSYFQGPTREPNRRRGDRFFLFPTHLTHTPQEHLVSVFDSTLSELSLDCSDFISLLWGFLLVLCTALLPLVLGLPPSLATTKVMLRLAAWHHWGLSGMQNLRPGLAESESP